MQTFNPLHVYGRLLEEAGIPTISGSYNSKEEPHFISQFTDDATDEQKKQAEQIAQDVLNNLEQYESEHNEKQAEIDKYGSEKNMQMAKLLLDKGLLTQEELDQYFN